MTPTEQNAPAIPPPRADPDSQPYWAGLRDHRLVLQRCRACGRTRFPPSPSCPYCAAPETQLQSVTGNGRIYSWIVVHRAFDPVFRDQTPYLLVAVDVDGGARIVGRLEGLEGTDRPEIGGAVEATFHDHDEWTELRFRPA